MRRSPTGRGFAGLSVSRPPVIGLTTYLAQAQTGVWDVPASFLPAVYFQGVTAAGGVAGACSVVLMESFAGGAETPSYGLGLAWANRNGVLRSREAAAASVKRDVFICGPNLTLSALIMHLQIRSSLHPQR